MKIDQCERQKVAEQAMEIIAQAKVEANCKLQAELHRLEALKSVNKNIRDDEIQALEQQLQETLAQLELANWRLDSLRVIVSNQE